jgi:hypothetical protein
LLPLLYREILAREQQLSLGKILQDDNQFDAVIAPPEVWSLVQGVIKPPLSNKCIFIQLKELHLSPILAYTPESWANAVREQCERTAKGVVLRPEGVFYIHSDAKIWNEAGKDWVAEAEVHLRTIAIPVSFPHRQVLVAVEAIESSSGRMRILTWQLHPIFARQPDLKEEQIEDIVRIYNGQLTITP